MVEAIPINKYNLFAILAFVFAFVVLPVGVILGIIALTQIKKTGEKGRWIAWFPIWVGIILVGLIALSVIWFFIQRGIIFNS